jgi:hypothetical protein
VTLGVGTYFGLKSISRHDAAAAACPDLCADQHGVDLWNEATAAGNAATVAFVVGGVALAGGAVIWFTAKPSNAAGATAGVSVGPTSLHLRGFW